MTDNNKTVEVKKEVKEVTPQDFASRYQTLVKETGYQIVAAPTWVATNHGSFEMVVQMTVGKTPKIEEANK